MCVESGFSSNVIRYFGEKIKSNCKTFPTISFFFKQTQHTSSARKLDEK